ncbi:MAG: response regulator [Thiobacillus sp.]|nr:response regulator [Thiobacillus sp.]
MPEEGFSAALPGTVGATILVVDDAPPNVKLLRLILKDAGYRVLEAGSGPEALDILRREKPDAMVLDVRMPGMTGYEVCQAVRRDPEFATLPVIMVTALSLPEERIRGIEAGATDFISKPFNRKELLARIQASLALVQSARGGILPQLPGAVVITDPDWKILGMSPLASVLLGLPSPGFGPFDLSELFGPEAQSAAIVGGDFRFQAPSSRLTLHARQSAATDPAGNLVVRVIVLGEG